MLVTPRLHKSNMAMASCKVEGSGGGPWGKRGGRGRGVRKERVLKLDAADRQTERDWSGKAGRWARQLTAPLLYSAEDFHLYQQHNKTKWCVWHWTVWMSWRTAARHPVAKQQQKQVPNGAQQPRLGGRGGFCSSLRGGLTGHRAPPSAPHFASFPSSSSSHHPISRYS